MNERKTNHRELTYIALGAALIIGLGFGIIQLSLIFPIPGTKYMMMAPFLSMMFMIVQSRVDRKYGLLKLGIVFGLILTVVNPFMGIAILLTSVLSQATSLIVPFGNKYFLGSCFFSGYTGFVALVISKFLIGGVFEQISMLWIIAVGLICFVFGFFGALYANKILSYYTL